MRTRFIGRETEQAELVAALSRGGLVTVVGTGGVGKTRLVREVAPALAEQLDADLVQGWLADLPAGAGADAVAGALGFESAGAAALAIAEAGPLLVLDNCEHVVDGVRDLLTAVFGASNAATVVATSREPIDVLGERVLSLQPLGLPGPGGSDAERSPAVDLFLDRALAAGAALVRDGRTLTAVAELCRRLDGVPLAIELAAARTRSMSPSDLLGVMDQRLDLLRRANAGASRHGSMRAAIDVSVAMLSPAERIFFRRLGGFNGPFDVGLAHAVAGNGDGDRLRSLELLTRLVERSLVVAETTGPSTRYRLLELLRTTAEEMLVAGGELAEVQARFVDAMAATAERIIVAGLQRWSSEVLSAASSQFANLIAACNWCCVHDPTPDRAFRLLVPMFAAVHEGKPAEVLAAARRVTDRWPTTPGPWRAEALAVAATAAALAGYRSEVRTTADAVLSDPTRSLIAEALVERASGLMARGHDEAAAHAHFERARTAAAEVGFPALEREMTALSAAQLDIMGDADGAIEALAAAVARARADGDPFMESLARLLLSRTLLRRGDVEGAQRELDGAEAASNATGMPWWTAALLRTRSAVVASSPAGWAAAAPVVRRSVDFAARQGAMGELSLTLRGAALLAQRAGHTSLAAMLASAAPSSTAISVIPELFPGDAVALDEGDTPPPLADVVEVLRRARTALDRVILDAAKPFEGNQPAPPDRGAVLRREQDAWAVTFTGTMVRAAHLKGFGDLAVLLSRPRAEVHCLELMGGSDVAGDAGPRLDTRARREYQQRILELQSEIDEARDHHDSRRAERAELELDALVEQLAGAFGIHGASRRTGSSAEKARTAVTYRLRAAMRRLADLHPELGRHLANSVRTGTFCSYQPERETVWEVSDSALTS
ncbi:MAG: hypothetical protein Q8M22_08605 [Actinomycetota bacterium]|nr:hypothetical protein [Actinomycetota bacterium]